jgi:MarR family transcriptional regulator, lower aerobic nicotinate degradation pathway regulator
MPTIAKSSRKPQQLKSKPVKAAAVKQATGKLVKPTAATRASEKIEKTVAHKAAVVNAPIEKVQAEKAQAEKAPVEKAPVEKALIDRTSAFKAAAVKAAAAKSAAARPVVSNPAGTGSLPGYVLEDQIGFHLRRAHQRATSIFNDVMAPFDVTPTQFAALAKIDDLGAVSQTYLGRLTGMDAATILGVVGRLLRQGLIIARAEPGDMRMTVLELSPKGRQSMEAMKKMAASVTEKTLDPLSTSEAKTLVQLLAKLM